jgi:hypothetical protein
MSEEGGSINENTNLSGNEEEVSPTEHEAVPKSASEIEHEIVSPVTGEGTGIVEAATEEAMRGQDEPLEPSTIEQPQSELQVKPKKKQSSETIMRIQSSLADASNRIKKQTTQINKINQNLQSLQKQMKAGEKQIRSQMNKTQNQISQVYKIAQKRSDSKLQSKKKVSSNTRKRKKNKVTRMRQSKS